MGAIEPAVSICDFLDGKGDFHMFHESGGKGQMIENLHTVVAWVETHDVPLGGININLVEQCRVPGRFNLTICLPR